MANSRKLSLLIIVALFISVACNLPFMAQPTGTSTPALNATDIAQTVIAQMRSETATEESPAVQTTEPAATVTDTPAPQPTDTATKTQLPCNQAAFISDITIPDGTEIQTGTGFTKTWRLQNTGSCTWTSGYHLVFVDGDRMNAPDAVAVTGGTIPSGGTVDISVALTAPASAGTYRGNFRLRSSDGVVFGVGGGVSFYVEIKAVAPEAAEPEEEEEEPVVVGEPDLIISNITFDPYPPQKGHSVTVKVTSYNQGNAAAGSYIVKWWPGEYYATAACTWNMDGMVSKGGRVHTCVYDGYPSAYSGINTKAMVDTGGNVDESNEGNNTFLKKIDVSN